MLNRFFRYTVVNSLIECVAFEGALKVVELYNLSPQANREVSELLLQFISLTYGFYLTFKLATNLDRPSSALSTEGISAGIPLVGSQILSLFAGSNARNAMRLSTLTAVGISAIGYELTSPDAIDHRRFFPY